MSSGTTSDRTDPRRCAGTCALQPFPSSRVRSRAHRVVSPRARQPEPFFFLFPCAHTGLKRDPPSPAPDPLLEFPDCPGPYTRTRIRELVRGVTSSVLRVSWHGQLQGPTYVNSSPTAQAILRDLTALNQETIQPLRTEARLISNQYERLNLLQPTGDVLTRSAVYYTVMNPQR